MNILNAYAGLGGNRALWPTEHHITALEYTQELADAYHKLYPLDTVLVGDAHQYILDHAQKYDMVWSSPPCQSHSRMIRSGRNRKPRYPNMGLYEEIIRLEHDFKGAWVVENVIPYYGAMRGPQQIGRHLFWSNVSLAGIEDVKRPKNFINLANNKGKAELQKWLGIKHEGPNLYYEGSHCPAQVYRNMVHPKLGLDILNRIVEGRQ